MAILDWIVLALALAGVIIYGILKSRNIYSSENFLAGKRDLPWWTIGLSVMATQASAITFLSTPGQGFFDGMQFVQFYFGMPIAMIFLVIFILPVYYRLKVTTAYEFLEQRFDLRMRTLTSILFLIQRGVAASISIYAPSIVLCAVFGWNLALTNTFMALFVVLYTTSGGSAAVSRTQELQMTIAMGGLLLAFFIVLFKLPDGVGLTEAWQIAGATGKTQAVDWSFDWDDRYNFWSGVLGATFLFLSYFGTDQSQVGRYLSGKTLRESRIGLLFNGFIKIPMQFLVLAVGVMVFVFYQFNRQPVHFNQVQRSWVVGTAQDSAFTVLEKRNDSLHVVKQTVLLRLAKNSDQHDLEEYRADTAALLLLERERKQLRFQSKELLSQTDPAMNQDSLKLLKERNPDKYRSELETKYKDSDYVFINFILSHIPTGLVGLLLAMIFCASWSTTASELSALTATSVSDIYRRSINPGKDDDHYFKMSRWFTIGWGVFIVFFATYADLFDNLIQAVNMVGSVFYGTILGIFFTAFFLKQVQGWAVFWGAVIAQAIVLYLFLFVDKDAYLWYNPLGCGMVMGVGWLFQMLSNRNV